jgi:hypothetical protein
MSHRQKVDHLIAKLGQKGVGFYTVAPPIFRLLWVLGLEVPPSFFLGSRQLALVMGTTFGVLFGLFWGVVIWLWQWQREIPAGVAVQITVCAAVFAGLLFGLVMARTYRGKAAQLVFSSSSENYSEA